ncbi:gp74 [Burkholderia pseudomallei]|nr:gp74 [Burkholderia pseudomallei]CAJ5543190.1 gp74 [Burkholderia pseudomallei]CAJ8249014.1 gp74 [Burkholderia pseudomallei]CAK0058773.1 gp74 [Burkholderia pseudomallei]CAK0184345.1 gp74 [Burkholderia pseudomallei]
MKRTGFKRKPHSPFSSLTRTATLKRQKAIVKRIKRPTVAEGSKYLAA